MFKVLLVTKEVTRLYVQSNDIHTPHLKNIKATGKVSENKTIFVLKILPQNE